MSKTRSLKIYFFTAEKARESPDARWPADDDVFGAILGNLQQPVGPMVNHYGRDHLVELVHSDGLIHLIVSSDRTNDVPFKLDASDPVAGTAPIELDDNERLVERTHVLLLDPRLRIVAVVRGQHGPQPRAAGTIIAKTCGLDVQLLAVRQPEVDAKITKSSGVTSYMFEVEAGSSFGRPSSPSDPVEFAQRVAEISPGSRTVSMTVTAQPGDDGPGKIRSALLRLIRDGSLSPGNVVKARATVIDDDSGQSQSYDLFDALFTAKCSIERQDNERFIDPARLRAAVIDTYNDYRVELAAAIQLGSA